MGRRLPRSASRGRVEHRPEGAYFLNTPNFPCFAAADTTARCLARLATRYRAFWVGHPEFGAREGALPRRARDRGGVVEDALEWLRALLVEQGATPWEAGLVLYRGDQLLLDQHDGIPDIFPHLAKREYVVLQDCLQKAGFPRDLYYPVTEIRTVTEPRPTLGGVILTRLHYSPLAWARRQANPPPVLRVPTEEERLDALADACREFLRALVDRIADLKKGTPPVDIEELGDLQALHFRVTAFLVNLATERRELNPANAQPNDGEDDGGGR